MVDRLLIVIERERDIKTEETYFHPPVLDYSETAADAVELWGLKLTHIISIGSPVSVYSPYSSYKVTVTLS